MKTHTWLFSRADNFDIGIVKNSSVRGGYSVYIVDRNQLGSQYATKKVAHTDLRDAKAIANYLLYECSAVVCCAWTNGS